MNKKIIVANWKMNPQTLTEAKTLLCSSQSGLAKSVQAKVIFCPPFVFLNSLRSLIAEGFYLGAQNLFYENRGAFTGEISPLMLKNLSCEYVIIGHSERKKYLTETDELINKKVIAGLKAGLKPILCIGEAQKQAEGMTDTLKKQLQINLVNIPERKLKNLIITYEPVWAISTTENSQPCQPDDALVAKLFIRKLLFNFFGRRRAERVPILYGGSVDSIIAADYINQAQFDGLLVGGASLKAGEFIKLVKSID